MERTGLRVIDGRLTDRTRRDETRVEVIAQFHEVDDFVATALPVVEEWRNNLIKLGQRNRVAWDEALHLGGPDNAA